MVLSAIHYPFDPGSSRRPCSKSHRFSFQIRYTFIGRGCTLNTPTEVRIGWCTSCLERAGVALRNYPARSSFLMAATPATATAFLFNCGSDLCLYCRRYLDIMVAILGVCRRLAQHIRFIFACNDEVAIHSHIFACQRFSHRSLALFAAVFPFSEAGFAVHRTVSAGLEWDLAFLLTVSAHRLVHFPWTSTKATSSTKPTLTTLEPHGFPLSIYVPDKKSLTRPMRQDPALI